MQSFLLKVFRKIRLTPEKPKRNPVTFQDFAVGGVTQQILQRNPAFFDFFCTFAVLVYGAQGIRKADGRVQHAPPVVPFGSADVDLKSVVRSGGENIIARFFFLKTGFSVRYGDIVSTASSEGRRHGWRARFHAGFLRFLLLFRLRAGSSAVLRQRHRVPEA